MPLSTQDSAQSTSLPDSTLRSHRVLLWLALLCAVLYAPDLGNGFVYDDKVLMLNSDRLIHATPRLAFTSDFWGMGTDNWITVHYRPLAMLAFSGVHWIFGLNRFFGLTPFAYHSVNIGLHIAATVSLYLLLSALGYGEAVSFAASLLFAVHPLHVEPVAWMTGLTEMLAGALYLGALAAFAHGRRGWSWILAGAAMLTKESSLSLPGLIFILAWFNCCEKSKWRTAIMATIPYAALAAAYVTARGLILPHPPRGVLLRVYEMRWPAIPAAIAHYLQKLFCPWPLAIHYELPGPAERFFALLFIAAFLVLAINIQTWRHDLAMAGALIAIPLAVPVITSPIMTQWLQVADRYAYLSVAGACLLVATVLNRFPRTLLAGCILILPLAAWGTNRQIKTWENDETFWTHTLEVTPSSKPAALNLAAAMFDEGRFTEMEVVYIRALRYHPGDPEILRSLHEIQKFHPRRSP